MVFRAGEHLDGAGNPCTCTRYYFRGKEAEPVPSELAPAEFKPLSQLKKFRLPQWWDSEADQAARRGVVIWVRSREEM
jgi:hypothetical protein